jgi:hypothetical protein
LRCTGKRALRDSLFIRANVPFYPRATSLSGTIVPLIHLLFILVRRAVRKYADFMERATAQRR